MTSGDPRASAEPGGRLVCTHRHTWTQAHTCKPMQECAQQASHILKAHFAGKHAHTHTLQEHICMDFKYTNPSLSSPGSVGSECVIYFSRPVWELKMECFGYIKHFLFWWLPHWAVPQAKQSQGSMQWWSRKSCTCLRLNKVRTFTLGLLFHLRVNAHSPHRAARSRCWRSCSCLCCTGSCPPALWVCYHKNRK